MASTETQPKKSPFISLRLQLLIGFTLVFSGVFAGAYYWFYKFVTDTALNRIRDDLVDILHVAAEDVDGDVLLSLSRGRQSTPEGQSKVTDRRYWDHVRWLATVEGIEPRAYVYTYVVGPRPNSVVFIGSGSAVNRYREKADGTVKVFDGAKFLQFYEPKKGAMAQGFSTLTLLDTPYADGWGSWITGYMPVRNSEGHPLTAIGVDFRADYVIEVQNAIRQQVVISFFITYGILFLLVQLISRLFTNPLVRLTRSAERIGKGAYTQDMSQFQDRYFDDEMSTFARVFDVMTEKVRKREESLRQQVVELKIEIDQVKRQKQVKEIIDTDFFQDLQLKARNIRNKSRNYHNEAAE